MSAAVFFPNDLDKNRILQEQRWYNMLISQDTGNYKLSVDQSSGKINKTVINTMVPIASTISDINSDLLFGEFPVIEAQVEQDKINEAFNDYAFDSDFETKVSEAANVTSAQGTSFCRFWKVDGKTYYDFVKSSNTIWEEDYTGLTNVRFIENIEKKKNNQETWYEIQEHRLDNKKHIISHYYIITDDTRLVKDIEEIEAEVITGYDFLPVSKIINQGRLGKDTGRSDYEGKEQLFSEIDNRIDQNNSILEDNADPWIGLPAGVLDMNGNFNRRFGKMFEKGVSGSSVDNQIDIVSYGAESIVPSMEHIKQMVEMCFFTSRISAPIAGLMTTNGGQAESGRALKWKSVNTLSMITRKRKYWEKFIRDFVFIWGSLENYKIEKKMVAIEWKDGLPMDDKEIIDGVIAQVNAKIMSRQKAVGVAQEISDEAITEELNLIDGEEAQRFARESVNLGNAITI